MTDRSHTAPARKLRVFLCHVSEDKPAVRDIYQKLQICNIQPWLDEKDLLPGQNWELLIPDVIRQCDIVLICLSRTFLLKEGFNNYEFHVISEAAKRKPQNTIYQIPYRLDDCEIPSSLASIHYVSNFIPEDFDKLLAACEKRREWLNTTQALNIEPIHSRASGYTPNPSALPRNFSEQTPPQRDFFNEAPERIALPGNGAGQRPNDRFGDPFPEIWNVPRRHNAFFTGRAPVLNQLLDTFRVKNDVRTISPQAITGLGGMGKTQVAAEYAYRFRADYQAVLWVRADTQENLLADFKTIAHLLKLPQTLFLRDQTSLMQTMRDWFKNQSDWLLIFDNADNPSLAVPFLPPAARGHILTTTRAGAVVAWASSLRLEALEIDAGALCILRRAGQLTEQQQLLDAPIARVEAARQLAGLMQGLPLALEQAGAYINDTGCGVRKYLELYKKYRAEIQSRPYGDAREYLESVASVWRISRSMVEHSNPAAADLLRLCAFLAPEGIPDELILKGAPKLGPLLGPMADNELMFNQAISVLKSYSLLDREVDQETELSKLSIHRIMQEILHDEMDQRTRRLWAERAVRAVELASQSLPDAWSLLQAHARKCQQLIEQWRMTFSEAKRLLKWIEKFEE